MKHQRRNSMIWQVGFSLACLNFSATFCSAQTNNLIEWMVDGVAHQPVTDRTGLYKGEVSDEVEQIRLIPYGCTKVRVVAFPVVK